MAEKHIFTLTSIIEYCAKAENPNLFSKGEKSYNAGRVTAFNFNAELKIIGGIVEASFKKQKYKVKICLTDDYKIDETNTSCDCANGMAFCSHVVALGIHSYNGISCTDVSCGWKHSASSTMDETRLQGFRKNIKPY